MSMYRIMHLVAQVCLQVYLAFARTSPYATYTSYSWSSIRKKIYIHLQHFLK